MAEELVLPRGKHPATEDSRDKMFHDYVDSSVIDLSGPPPTGKPGHGNLMPSPRLMLGNGPDDSVVKGFQGAGDCVFAMIINLMRLAWAISGKGVFPANGAQAIAGYSEVTGYVIGDDSTDNGTNMRTALNWLRRTGILDAHGTRHKIGAFAKIDITNWNHVLWALYLMDTGVPLGIMFPSTAMTQFNQRKPWTPVAGSTNEGGHCILLDLFLLVETWARDQQTDPAGEFLKQNMDEAYVVFDQDGLTPSGQSLEGFDAQQLLMDVKAGA